MGGEPGNFIVLFESNAKGVVSLTLGTGNNP
jgi:hypothetical protein